MHNEIKIEGTGKEEPGDRHPEITILRRAIPEPTVPSNETKSDTAKNLSNPLKDLSWKIGNVHIENPLVLAPMEAVNCASFRLQCTWAGAGLVYTDMIDTQQFLRILKENNDDEELTIRQLINPQKDERPLTVQLGSGEPEELVRVAQIVEKHADILDLNCGCPLGYMLGRKGGAYMLKHHHKLTKMVSGLVDTVKIPVTAKIRSGWKSGEENVVETAQALEGLGVSAIGVHARTCKDRYRTKADWSHITNVVRAVQVPVIGNGDVTSGAQAVTMKGQTGCSGVMIARAAQGNPEIFTHGVQAFLGQRYVPRSRATRFTSFHTFLKLYASLESRSKLSELQDHAIWWVNGLADASALKQRILKATSIDELKTILS